MDEELFAHLATTPLFQDLGPGELSETLGGVQRVRLSDGTALMEQGDPPNGAYLLLEGRARVFTKLPGGGETLIAEVEPGSLIGELALIRGAKRGATVRAVGEVVAAFVERQFFIASLLQLRPAAIKLLRRLALILTERLSAAHGRIRAHVESQGPYFWPLPAPGASLPPDADFDVRAFLPILPCFKDFDRADIDAVFAQARIESLPCGQDLADLDARSDTAYLVVHGAVAFGFLCDGKFHQLNVLGPGQFCLIGSVLEERPADASYVVRETATLLALPGPAVRALSGAGGQTTLRFLGAVNEHQANMIIRAGNHLTRLVGLSRLHRQFGSAVGTAV